MQELTPVILIDELHAARGHVKRTLATLLQSEFTKVYEAVPQSTGAYEFNSQAVARRRLKNTCLDFHSTLNTNISIARAKTQYDQADRVAALSALVSHPSVERDQALAHFHAFAAGDPLMLNKWFSFQAMADTPGLLQQVPTHIHSIITGYQSGVITPFTSLPASQGSQAALPLSNPNRARSLVSVFGGNHVHFHAQSGEGYAFIADTVIELDALNPQVRAVIVIMTSIV